MSDKVIFHGACVTCVSQTKYGNTRCIGCMYFESDWNKPDLSTGFSVDGRVLQERRNEFIAEYAKTNKFDGSPMHDKYIIITRLNLLSPSEMVQVVDLINSFKRG